MPGLRYPLKILTMGAGLLNGSLSAAFVPLVRASGKNGLRGPRDRFG
jgi:hypothetical protein